MSADFDNATMSDEVCRRWELKHLEKGGKLQTKREQIVAATQYKVLTQDDVGLPVRVLLKVKERH